MIKFLFKLFGAFQSGSLQGKLADARRMVDEAHDAAQEAHAGLSAAMQEIAVEKAKVAAIIAQLTQLKSVG